MIYSQHSQVGSLCWFYSDSKWDCWLMGTVCIFKRNTQPQQHVGSPRIPRKITSNHQCPSTSWWMLSIQQHILPGPFSWASHYNELFHTLSMPKPFFSQSICTSTLIGFLAHLHYPFNMLARRYTNTSYTKHLKQSMTTFPLTDWIGSTTTPTARGFNCSKLCCVLISSAFLSPGVAFFIFKYQVKVPWQLIIMFQNVIR